MRRVWLFQGLCPWAGVSCVCLHHRCPARPDPQECHCMLFLTEDNDFRGEDQAITLQEIQEATEGM